MVPLSLNMCFLLLPLVLLNGVNSVPITSADQTPQKVNLELPKQVTPLNRETRSAELQKRPFCNAFTGCGRKRSGYNKEPLIRDPSDLFDFNSEPAVADIVQQIMSDAKIWEALQTANRDLKNAQAPDSNHYYPTFSAQ